VSLLLGAGKTGLPISYQPVHSRSKQHPISPSTQIKASPETVQIQELAELHVQFSKVSQGFPASDLCPLSPTGFHCSICPLKTRLEFRMHGRCRRAIVASSRFHPQPVHRSCPNAQRPPAQAHSRLDECSQAHATIGRGCRFRM